MSSGRGYSETVYAGESAGLGGVSVPPPASRAGGLSPAAVAELALAAPLLGGADAAVLRASGERAFLRIERGGRDLASIEVDEEVGAAAIVILARAVGIDPLVETGTLEARGNVGRVRVRAGAAQSELLVSATASRLGMELEVRRLRGGADADTGVLRRCPRCAGIEPAPAQRCSKDGTALVPLPDDPRPGGTVGAYRIRAALGEGGMGAVLSGEHVLIGRPVAIKVIRRAIARNSAAARAFLHEARAAAGIRHPNVVQVTDYGLMTNGKPFMVMELLAGTSLQQRIDSGGALAPRAALSTALEIARGLEAAHAAGVFHNDLKPSNVVLLEGSSDEAPVLKLVDFGAASLVNDQSAEDESVAGTPHYMAPERVRGLPFDARSDVYSLGIVMYEMLSGSMPFGGEQVREVMLAQVLEPAPPVTSPEGPLPPLVVRLVARALRKSPDERPQSASEMIGEIERARVALDQKGWRRWLP